MADLYCFNPDCEMAVANGSPYYTPPANITRMSEELAYLPAWMGGEEDAVLLPTLPCPDFLRKNRELFGLLPQLVLWEEYAPDPAFRPAPWGYSPRMDHLLQAACWKEKYKELMSRITARACLVRVCSELPFIGQGVVPDVCHTLEVVRQAASAEKVVVKAPWSSSGKGVLHLGPGALAEKEAEWVRGILRRQGYIMVEKRLDKVCDFAMEFVSEGGKCRFLAWSFFATGSGGAYRGNFLGGQDQIETYLLHYTSSEELAKIRKSVTDSLNVLVAPWYEGILGVDMMVYKGGIEGKYQIQPCVEINLRHTMGYLAHRFSSRFVAENASGWFTLSFFSGTGEALQHHLQNERNFPVQVSAGKITSGYHALAPVNGDTGFTASVRLVSGIASAGELMHDLEHQLSQ